MRLLFITQKLHGQDAFGVLWVREFVRQGFEVTVVCLEGTVDTEGFEFPVFTLGKERGASKFQSILSFEKLIITQQYDRVFVHMAPVWYALGFWWWILRRTPTYLWYTHYTMQLGVRLFGFFGTRFFCATPQSLPQYDGSPKKTVTGHGIDLHFWPQRQNVCDDSRRLLVVHRLSRSKRLELSLRALALLDGYSLDIYGVEAEPAYAAEMKQMAADLGLSTRVMFYGTTPMETLPEIYSSHRLILNMASETIDKTMIEAMTCGCFPVTTKGNAEAIGLFSTSTLSPDPSPAGRGEILAPTVDTPEAIAAFVRAHAEAAPISGDEMYRIVEKHSLEGLMKKMGAYIREGR